MFKPRPSLAALAIVLALTAALTRARAQTPAAHEPARAAAHIAQGAGVPLITPAATNALVTRAGDYVFRARLTDPERGALPAKFAARTLKARRAAVLADTDSVYSRSMAEVFARRFTALGGRITSKQTYSRVDTEFAGLLVAVRETRPDVIFVPGYYGQAGVIARQAKRLGMRQPLSDADGWDAPEKD
jgi:branched-chain amino acid transport system substrate-binding protein